MEEEENYDAFRQKNISERNNIVSIFFLFRYENGE